MFDFIKKLFAKEKEPVVEFVSQKELLDWYQKKKNQVLDDADVSYKTLLSESKDEIQATLDNCEKLEQASLHNPKIPEREKHFMEGNRKAYVKSVRLFLRNISFPEGIHDLAAVSDFVKRWKLDLERFGKSTVKAYQILQHFFANESGKIAENIRRLDSKVKAMSDLVASAHLDRLDALQKNIEHLDNLKALKKELKERIKDKESLLDEDDKKLKELKSCKDSLYGSDDFASLENHKKDLALVSDQVRAEENAMLQYFSVIEKSLKKYGRIAMDNSDLIASYLKDPVKALHNDHDLLLLDIFSGLKRSLGSSSLGLDDKKKEKTLNAMATLDKNFLSSFQDRYSSLLDKRSRLSSQISSASVIKEIDGVKDNIAAVEVSLSNAKKELSGLKDELNKADIDKIRKAIIHDAGSVFGIELTISNS